MYDPYVRKSPNIVFKPKFRDVDLGRWNIDTFCGLREMKHRYFFIRTWEKYKIYEKNYKESLTCTLLQQQKKTKQSLTCTFNIKLNYNSVPSKWI